jgi:restriction system protein
MGRKRIHTQVPTYDEFMKPLVQVLVSLGGSGTIEEINSKVYELLKLSDEVLQTPHGDDEARTEVEYRLAWTRTYLKKYGLVNNSERGIWSLTQATIDPNSIDPDEIVRVVKEKHRQSHLGEEKSAKSARIEEIDEQPEEELIWKQKLLGALFKISPDAFERLAQRLLRESGFTQVEVTGRVGDGGIDGKGIVRISGFLSFHVIFQCKKYRKSVTPGEIRDFRGAMQGRADKGLFITTGSFTREAVKEATRDGAPPIDLIDGELLCDKLKELRLGVSTKQIESVEIEEEWFTKL